MSKLEAKIILSGSDKASTPLRNVAKNTKTLADKLLTTKTELKNLEKLQKNLNGFTQLKNKTKAAATELKQARSLANQLAQALKQTSNPTKEMARDFEKAKQRASTLKNAFQGLQISTHQQRNELLKSGISTKNLAQHQVQLKSKISGANQSIDQQKNKLAQLNEKMRRSNQIRANYDKSMQRNIMVGAAGYGALATGRTISRGMRNLLGVGYEFDASMSATQAVTRIDDKNDPRMLALRQQARTLPLQSKFTDSEVAQGQYFLGRTGYSADQILKAMPHMLNLAAAGDMDLGTTADIASNIQKAMRIPAEEMGKVSDVLTAAFTRNNVDIPMLGESLKYTGGLARQYGQSLETLTTATALLGNAGVQGSQAGTSLRQVLIRVGNSAAVKKLGVQTADKNGNMRDLDDIFEEIQKATSKMGNLQRAAIYKQIAGQIGVTGFNELMATVETGEFQEMRKNLYNSKGEADKVAKIKKDNLKGDMTILHAAFENISVELFEKNDSWLRKFVQGFSNMLHSVSNFLKENPKLSKAIIMIGAGIAAVTTVFGALAIAIMGIFGPMIMTKFILSNLGLSFSILPKLISGVSFAFRALGTVFAFVGRSFSLFPKLISGISIAIKALGTVFAFVGRLFLLNPIGLAITAIAAASFLIIKYWEPIKGFFTELWTSITDVWNGAVEWFSNIGSNIVDGLINGITAKCTSLKNTISELTDGVTGWFKEALGIHSPSRLFADFGGYTVKGYQLGIENNTGAALRTMGDFSKQVSDKALNHLQIDNRPPISASNSYNGALQSMAAPQINITINASAGMNEQDLAQRVGYEISRHLKTQNNSYRNSYRDID